jgi:hypothetical protein
MRISALPVTLAVIVALVGCASEKPVSSPLRQLRTQPDSGRPDDYLHFAGLSYGDTFDTALELFGRPTEVDLNEGGGSDRYYSFATAYFEIDGERCLAISYYKLTRQVNVVEVSCDETRILILRRGIDDPKLGLFGEHRRRVMARYGSPSRSIAGNHIYEFGTRGGPSGLVTFICYDFWEEECRRISVQWFY